MEGEEPKQPNARERGPLAYFGKFLISVISALMTLSIVIYASSNLSPDHNPRWGPIQAMPVITGNMSPMLDPGDVAIIRATPPEQLAEGDVIAFRAGQEGLTALCSRVIAVASDDKGIMLRTKGDAVVSADMNPVRPEGLIGRLLFRIPNAGWVIQLTKHDSSLVLMFVVPIASLILFAILRKLWRRDESAESKAG